MALHIHDYSAGESAESREIHDINVTPFIDVMLVLLIILWSPRHWQPSIFA